MKPDNAIAVQPTSTFAREDRAMKQRLAKLKLAISVAMVFTMALSATAQRRGKDEVVVSSNYQNPEQLALKAWYPANQSAIVTLHAGASNQVFLGSLSQPGTIVFDGSNVWVEHVASGGNFVDKLRASDNQYLGSYYVGGSTAPSGFDGVNIIAPDHGNTGKVYFVRAADGNVASCSTGVATLDSVAFDGQYVWVSSNAGNVVKLSFNNATRACNTVCTSANQGSRLYDLVSDGNGYTWATAIDTNQVIEFNGSCGVNSTVSAPGPVGIVFDGTYLWTANDTGSSISQISDNGAGGGSLVSTTNLNYSPWLIAYDGANIWTTGPTPGMVSKMSASNPTPTLTYYQACNSASSFPLSLAFDGANMWVGCEGVNQLGKM